MRRREKRGGTAFSGTVVQSENVDASHEMTGPLPDERVSQGAGRVKRRIGVELEGIEEERPEVDDGVKKREPRTRVDWEPAKVLKQRFSDRR